MTRQLYEAVVLRRLGEDIVLNSKGEYNRCTIGRLTISEDKAKEVKEPEKDKETEDRIATWEKMRTKDRRTEEVAHSLNMERGLARTPSRKRTEVGVDKDYVSSPSKKKRTQRKYPLIGQNWGLGVDTPSKVNLVNTITSPTLEPAPLEEPPPPPPPLLEPGGEKRMVTNSTIPSDHPPANHPPPHQPPQGIVLTPPPKSLRPSDKETWTTTNTKPHNIVENRGGHQHQTNPEKQNQPLEDDIWENKGKEDDLPVKKKKIGVGDEVMSVRQVKMDHPEGGCETGHQLTSLNQPNQHTSLIKEGGSRPAKLKGDLPCSGEPRAVTISELTESEVKSRSITFDRKKVTGITVNGKCLMELQKIRRQKGEETPSPNRKQRPGRQKNNQQTTPSINKPGDMLQYLVKKKVARCEDNQRDVGPSRGDVKEEGLGRQR